MCQLLYEVIVPDNEWVHSQPPPSNDLLSFAHSVSVMTLIVIPFAIGMLRFQGIIATYQEDDR